MGRPTSGLLPGYGFGAKPEPHKTNIPGPDEFRSPYIRNERLTGERRQVELLALLKGDGVNFTQFDTGFLNTESYDSVVCIVYLNNNATFFVDVPGIAADWQSETPPPVTDAASAAQYVNGAAGVGPAVFGYGPDAVNGSNPLMATQSTLTTMAPPKWLRFRTGVAAAFYLIVYGIRRPANTQRPAAAAW